MKLLKYILSGLIFNVISFAALSQCALYEIPIEQLIQESQVIIEGEVLQQVGIVDEVSKKIFTKNTIRVFSIFKGNVEEEITIITEGGTFQNKMQVASSLLKLSTGDLGLFYLNKETRTLGINNENVYQVYASMQGFLKYQLREHKVIGVFNTFDNADGTFYNWLWNRYQLNRTKIFRELLWQSDDGSERLTIISNFSPSSIQAGKGEQLTINGSGFGVARGNSKVLFKEADNGGTTEVEPSPTQYISWSDSKIVVEVPSHAGTGKIAVDIGSAKDYSTAVLTIPYALINTGVEDNSKVHIPYHVARNSNKGYEWSVNASFLQDSVAFSNFMVSFKKWRCTTYINWTIGNTTSVNSSVQDTISVITFDENNTLPAGVLGICYAYYSGCSDDEWYIEEQDLLFRKSDRWYFGDGPIGANKLDFQSVALHELGHAHQLAHVIDVSDLMHYSLSNGEIKRSISAINLEGALWMVNSSIGRTTCTKEKMMLLDNDLCEDPYFGFYSTTIYPNPFTDKLSIDFYLTENTSINMSLYDITGKLIVSYSNASALKGYLPVSFNVFSNEISAGVYVIDIRTGTQQLKKKLIKQ